MSYIALHNLKPGDKVEVPKSGLNLVQHHVIVMGKNILGQDLIAENVAGLYVRVVLASDFFKANPKVNRITRFQGTSIQRRLAIERALEKLGSSYDLINFNCEHFANYVQSGRIKSDQVGWGILALGIISAIIILAD